MEDSCTYLLALEGGGTRSQAVVLDIAGHLLGEGSAADVNANFVPFEQAQAAAREAVIAALQAAGVSGRQVVHFALGLVGLRLGAETFGCLLPYAKYHYFTEREVTFARAGVFRPHGVALVAATGASAFGVRSDDGRQAFGGGWGSLLGDEGSAYAIGLQALRGAARAFEGRLEIATEMVAVVCEHFGLHAADFRQQLVQLAYHKPLSRAEVASLAPRVAQLAQQGDPLAMRILDKAAADLSALALFVARQLFTAEEAFAMIVAGGLVNAGELILGNLRRSLAQAFPQARLMIGAEAPALALGRLALFNLSQHT